MISRTDAHDQPQDAENTSEAVLILHALAYDAASIAQKMRLDQASVLYVIEHGGLPAKQMELDFRDLPDLTSYEREDQR